MSASLDPIEVSLTDEAVRRYDSCCAGMVREIGIRDLVRPVIHWWLQSRGIDPSEDSGSEHGLVGVFVFVPIDGLERKAKLLRLAMRFLGVLVGKILYPVCVLRLTFGVDDDVTVVHLYRHGRYGLAHILEEKDHGQGGIVGQFLAIDVQHVPEDSPPDFRPIVPAAINELHKLCVQRVVRPAGPLPRSASTLADYPVPNTLDAESQRGLGSLPQDLHTADDTTAP